MLVYPGALDSDAGARAYEELFAENVQGEGGGLVELLGDAG